MVAKGGRGRGKGNNNSKNVTQPKTTNKELKVTLSKLTKEELAELADKEKHIKQTKLHQDPNTGAVLSVEPSQEAIENMNAFNVAK